MRASITVPAYLVVTLVACGGDDDGGPGAYEADAFCDVVRADPLADTDPTPFGPTVAGLFGPAAGEHPATLVYDDGGTTELAVRVTLADDPALLVEQRNDPGHDVGWCDTEVQRRARIEYVSADGRFAEAFETVLRATAGTEVSSSGEIEAGRLAGSATPPVPDADRTVFLFDAAFRGAAGTGTIGVGIERQEGDAVSFELLPVGSFSWGAVP